MALGVKVPGDKIKKTKHFEFRAFIGLSGQNQLYHTPLLFKILDLTKNKKIVNDPFKVTCFKMSPITQRRRRMMSSAMAR